MSTRAAPGPAARSRIAVTAAYAAQGLGYAVVVTSLPVFKDQRGIDDVAVALIVLLVCITAALGSVIADVLANPIAAIVGFALAGVAVGALVPLAFTSAGGLAPARSDELIARVNLFNYAGAVLGRCSSDCSPMLRASGSPSSCPLCCWCRFSSSPGGSAPRWPSRRTPRSSLPPAAPRHRRRMVP